MEAIACAPSWSTAISQQCHRRFTRPTEASKAAASSDRKCGRMFVFGAGYVGRYVAERLNREGWHVSGTCRDAIKKRELEELGLDAFIYDMNITKMRTLSTLHDATHILISIPPTCINKYPQFLSLHEDLQCSLSCGDLQWLGYLSSTSVYGDWGGAWVDEDSPENTTTKSGELLLTAEKDWLRLGCKLGFSVNVFRLGGIYGLRRSALDTIIRNKPLSKRQKKREHMIYTSRVHVEDIYHTIKASFKAPSSGRIYNVVDDDPAPRREVFAFARDLIENKWPGLIVDYGKDDLIYSTHDDPTAQKRVSNTRIKNELGVKLVHPTYREGLKSIIASMDLPCTMP